MNVNGLHECAKQKFITTESEIIGAGAIFLCKNLLYKQWHQRFFSIVSESGKSLCNTKCFFGWPSDVMDFYVWLMGVITYSAAISPPITTTSRAPSLDLLLIGSLSLVFLHCYSRPP